MHTYLSAFMNVCGYKRFTKRPLEIFINYKTYVESISQGLSLVKMVCLVD